MYTPEELRAATKIIQEIARGHKVSEERVRADLKEAMDMGRSNPDPAVQARWTTFRYAGEEPTVEEFILWATSLTKDKLNYRDVIGEIDPLRKNHPYFREG